MKTVTPLLVMLAMCLAGCQHEEAPKDLPIEHQSMGMVQPSPRLEVILRQSDGQDGNRLVKREYKRKGRTENAQNAEGGFGFSMGDMSSSNESGNRAPDVAGQVAANGFIVIGGLLIAGGVGLIVLPVKKVKTGVGLIAAGVAVGLAPLIFREYGHWIVLGGLVVGAGYAAYILLDASKKQKLLNYYNEATSEFTMSKLHRDGDLRAAGAVGHIVMNNPYEDPERIRRAAMFKSDATHAKPERPIA